MWNKIQWAARFLPGPFFPVARKLRDWVLWPTAIRRRRILREIEAKPMDPHLHQQLGELVLHSPPLPPLGPILAAAHFRTSLAFSPAHTESRLGLAWAHLKLGTFDTAHRQFETLMGDDRIHPRIRRSALEGLAQCEKAQAQGQEAWRLERIETTSYMRYRTVAEECVNRGSADKLLLDVGGGNGALSLFLPESRYVLADPAANGISATPLPFPDTYFDITVAIDTLEHISPQHRQLFLSELIRVSRETVFLVAPFAPEDNELAFDPCLMRVFPNPWTHEHLRYGLPTRRWLEACLSSLGVEFTLKPFAVIANYFPLLLVQLLLVERFDFRRLEQIAEFYNTRYGIEVRGEPPVGYLAEITVRKEE